MGCLLSKAKVQSLQRRLKIRKRSNRITPDNENEDSAGAGPITDGVPMMDRERHIESEIRKQLQEDGILSQTERGGVSFFIPLDGRNGLSVSRRPPRLLERLSHRPKDFDVHEKMIMADVLHEEKLKEKGVMSWRFEERKRRVMANREIEKMERRYKTQQKMGRHSEHVRKMKREKEEKKRKAAREGTGPMGPDENPDTTDCHTDPQV